MNPGPHIPLSPGDRALLLAITDPAAVGEPPRAADASAPSDVPASSADPLERAHILARPDIRPHLEALEALRAFRRELLSEHRTDQAIDALLHIARTSESLVERRLAATAALRALTGRQWRTRQSRAVPDSRVQPPRDGDDRLQSAAPSEARAPRAPHPSPAPVPDLRKLSPRSLQPAPATAGAQSLSRVQPEPSAPAAPASPPTARECLPLALSPLASTSPTLRPVRRPVRQPTRTAALAGAAGLAPTGRFDTS